MGQGGPKKIHNRAKLADVMEEGYGKKDCYQKVI
jgi:hypothetical protein